MREHLQDLLRLLFAYIDEQIYLRDCGERQDEKDGLNLATSMLLAIRIRIAPIHPYAYCVRIC